MFSSEKASLRSRWTLDMDHSPRPGAQGRWERLWAARCSASGFAKAEWCTRGSLLDWLGSAGAVSWGTYPMKRTNLRAAARRLTLCPLRRKTRLVGVDGDVRFVQKLREMTPLLSSWTGLQGAIPDAPFGRILEALPRHGQPRRRECALDAHSRLAAAHCL